MSQMPQQTAPARCPSCDEPLESGDRFCGACGHDLSAVPTGPAASGDTPTLTMDGAAVAGRVPGTAPAVPPAPGAPGAGDTVHLAIGAHGTEPGADGPPPVPRPAHAEPHAAGTAGVRLDRPRPADRPDHTAADGPGGPTGQPGEPGEPDEYPLAPPEPPAATAPPGGDPWARGPQPGAPAGPGVCVACRAGTVDSDGYCENCGHAQPRERDHMERDLGPVAAVSDRGLRHHRNEDAFAVLTAPLPDGAPPAVLALVCDGVSSATRPDDASLAAAETAGTSLCEALPRGTHPQAAMHDAILTAARAVTALAEEPETAQEHAPHQNAPACTFVGAVVTHALLVIGWVGDSRAYWIPADRSAPPARLTEDDSWAAQMVAAGLMNEAEAYADERAHAITGWLGADAYELEPHTAAFKPDRPGVVVVCTDGLWNYAESAEELAALLPSDAAARPLHAARVLVGHALDGGGHDNVTVAVVPFPVPPQGAGSA
ncbi:serine/threonine protein phosphatase PrpC [Streptomyces sp. B3I7]|uniref:PP2C family serine/threonine-protein phosphatase n=1 Tax=Streptomyces sp. B3I7 TaxID=3042269 RepID=UPI002782B5AF|nr:PP2C family serine/threonine-protein phosphatase [Streptomyces sp. B3I7]MDQ0813385.1 serine/threonine protein phosphatase PrpC [Streptomyces sp. B3I7]